MNSQPPCVDVDGLLQDLTCPITMELFEDPVTVPCCGKAFSRHALIQHLVNNDRCPMCNGDLSTFDARTVARNVLLAGMVSSLQNNHNTSHPQRQSIQPESHRWSATLVPIKDSTMAEMTLSLEESKFSVHPSLFIAVLDCSGSMGGGPEHQVRSAIRHIISMAAHSPCVKLVILSYSSECIEIQNPQSYVIGGGTNFRGAFAMVQKVLSRYICSDDPQLAMHPNNVSTVNIAFLTDGEDTCGGRDRLVNEFKTILQRQWGSNPLSVHAMGFGQSCDRSLLEDMRKAGTVEGMFLYAEPTDNDDALCQKLTGIFEISSQASTVPLKLSIGNTTTEIRFPIDQYRHGQYRQWIEVDEKSPPVITIQSQLDQSITIPLMISPPTNETLQRWFGKVTDELASSIMDIEKMNLSPNLKELYCALLLQKIEALNMRVTDDSVRGRLTYLESQVDNFKIGNAINLGKLSDLRFASQFKNSSAVSVPIISTVLPPEPKRIDEGPSSERPLKHYSFNNVNKSRNTLQESIMAQSCDVLTDTMKTIIDQSSLDDALHKDVDGNTSWMLASYAGRSKILEAILKRHSNLPLEQTNNDNETAVSLAIKKRGFHHSLGVLLNAGATIPRHKTMERFAIENKYVITAQMISSFGEGSTSVDESMTTEYIQYVFNRVKSKSFDVQQFFSVALAKRMMPLVKELLDDFKAEPTIDMLNKYGIPKKPDTPDMDQYLQLTRMMVQSRPQLIKERTVDDGDSALSCAAQRGSLPHVEYFVNCGADLEQTNAKGNTTLYTSCFMGFPMIVEYLLDHGANIHATNDKGNSMLFGPCTRGSKDVAELLISRGLGVNNINKNGDTLVLICCRNGQHEMLEFILNYTTREYAERVAHIDGFNAVMASAEQDHPECIRVCHEYGMDLNQQTSRDNSILGLASPLHICSYYGRIHAMRMLLKLGSNPDLVDVNGQTPLHIAVIQGHVELIRTLRNHGAKLLIKDLSGNVPVAYCRDRLDVRKVLINPVMDVMMRLARGDFPPEDEKLACDALTKFSGVVGCLTTKEVVDVQDFDGSTPLIQAVIFGRSHLIQTLIHLGADPLKCNEFNMSSLAWAQWNRNKRIESLLKCEDRPTDQWIKLDQLDHASKRLLFMGVVPKNYRSVTRSGISQRMEAFINTPTEMTFSLSKEVHLTEPSRVILEQDWVKEFDHPTILHRIWDAKVFSVHKSVSNTIPVSDLLTISLFTNNPIIHQSINQSILTRDQTKSVYIQKLYQSLLNLPAYCGESYIGSETVQRKLYPKGKEFAWNHFVSSSALWRVSLENTPSFTSKSKLGTVFIIKSRTGRYVGPYSQFSFDAEVIILPGTKFKVTNWYHGGSEVVLGQSNIREHTFRVKEYDNERLNLQQVMDSEKALVIELTEL
jgi:ankyrin repeat protein